MFIKVMYGRKGCALVNSNCIISIRESEGELVVHTIDGSIYTTSAVTLDGMQRILNERSVSMDPIEQYVRDYNTAKTPG